MKAPIFIVGCDRSGTTLLRLILNRHPTLHIPNESGFLPKLSNNERSYGDFTQPHQRWFFIRDLQTIQSTSRRDAFSIFDLTHEQAETALREAAPTSYSGASAALYTASARKYGKCRWGDKTPQYIFHTPWLTKTFPNAKFVHIIRDGRDVAASILQLGWRPSFLKAADYWQERVSAGIESGKALGPERYYEVRYEHLITNSEATVNDLCLWLDLDFMPQMLLHYDTAADYVSDWKGHAMVRKPIDPSKVAAWEMSLSSRQIADIESVAGDLLAKLGYTITGAKIPFWLKLFRVIMKSLRSLFERSSPILMRLS